jgi:hypothetical protein
MHRFDLRVELAFAFGVGARLLLGGGPALRASNQPEHQRQPESDAPDPHAAIIA